MNIIIVPVSNSIQKSCSTPSQNHLLQLLRFFVLEIKVLQQSCSSETSVCYCLQYLPLTLRELLKWCCDATDLYCKITSVGPAPKKVSNWLWDFININNISLYVGAIRSYSIFHREQLWEVCLKTRMCKTVPNETRCASCARVVVYKK